MPINTKNYPNKVLVICLTPVASDPRVIRQVDSLLKMGCQVSVAGFTGKDSIDKRWDFIDLSLPKDKNTLYLPKDKRTLWERLKGINRHELYVFLYWKSIRIIHIVSKVLRLFASCSAIAERSYWANSAYPYVFNKLTNIPCKDYRLIICNDYDTAPLAYILSESNHCPFMIDCHEHALTQKKKGKFFQDIKWYFYERSYVHGLQKRYLKEAAAITTVSQGIATSLQDTYKLTSLPVVLRSTPFRNNDIKFHKTTKSIRLLYHGNLALGRGLLDIVEAMIYCPANYSLTIRGSGVPYLKILQVFVDKNNLKHKVFFEPPVPFDRIVIEANKFDVGVFVVPNISLQKEHVLPNKFFEYIMAGLALCVSDLPDMAEIVKKYDLGCLVPNAEPKEIAKFFMEMTPEKIDYYKQKSHKAAQELCWEKESKKFENICQKLLGDR
jgi:glycosyltransferase involved in cell wall biosynthesis